jgi:hypothetical protein
MFRKYEKTFRILVPQVSTKGKHYLEKDDVRRLLGSEVVITEKLDGANVGIIKHKGDFRLQKRGSLVGPSEHFQFNFFKAWSQQNRDKLLQIPDGTVLYGELMICHHTVHYDKLPDYFIAFAWAKQKSSYYYPWDELVCLCDDIGIQHAPEVARGVFRKDDLFDLIPNPSTFGSEPAEGIVVWNHKAGLKGKIVRAEFQKSMDDTTHWTRKPIKRNTLAEIK